MLKNIFLLDTIHSRTLLQAYQDDTTGKIKYDPFGTTFLPKFGSQLSSKSRLAGIFHINGNHWIVVHIDLQVDTLSYGDPAGASSVPDSNDVAALRWFISKHIPSFSLDALDLERLECPKQDQARDWWNCGIFSFNALEHKFFLEKHPIFDHTNHPIFADIARLELFCRIVKHHLQVSLSSQWPENLDG